MCRWGHTPLADADQFGHKQVAEHIQMWTSGETKLGGETLAAIGGEIFGKRVFLSREDFNL